MRRFTEAIFLPRDYYNFEFTLKENDFLISISLQPNAVDLRYFKLCILLDERI